MTTTTLHETSTAQMRRYPGAGVAVWRTTSAAGTAGPDHRIDREQVVVVLEGTLTAVIDGEVHQAGPGDSVVLPADTARQLRNDGASPLVTITAALAGGQARVGEGDPVVVPWSA